MRIRPYYRLLRRRVLGGGRFGALDVLPAVHSPELGNTRDLLVHLPPSYAGSHARYPVLYMHDGQNLFDPATSFAGAWRVDRALAALRRRGLEAIVVGIPNAGAGRIREYSPFAASATGGGEGLGEKYLDFVIRTVKPLIDHRFRTRPERNHTGIAGSSMGGLISLYAFFRRPAVFGYVGVLSPALWLSGAAIFAVVSEAGYVPGRVYLDVGRLEGERTVLLARRLRDLLVEKGYRGAGRGRDLMWVEDPRGRHHEACWGRRLRKALPFLLEPPPGLPTSLS